MRILIVTDAWYPQINGVVRTLTAMRDELTRAGDEVHMLTPEGFRSMPCPTYPEIPLSLVTARNVEKVVRQFLPCAIHIATEGPLGLAARRFCRKLDIPYTTAFHTRFPEYIEARFRIPANWVYPAMRWFHGHSSSVMAPTPTVVESLKDRKFRNVKLWGRGVDIDLFKPGPKAEIPGAKDGPVLLSVGRIAVEKNIGAFLELEAEGTKVVVGDGPQIGELRKKYPDVVFVGAKHGEELVSYYNAADVFVFPSLTDTFGLVMLEAMACGVPVAAYPVMGPKDVVTDEKVGSLHDELGVAVNRALGLKRADCRAFAVERSWENCAKTFRSYLHEFDPAMIHGTLVDRDMNRETI
ncbi:glycosyltransferase family 4 protein [Aestuariispira insulae]|uniref:Glycosyltransferase involved in cell wall biosynthesis n=1 Tax=Aestuariispira insulae TaxID=1461337 RepID=A0A3D9HAX2_9PROT|nr:glycosyltransferase family 1 protein [Aestuariispira insulae]RED46136.1 glycosyltransferase involved in cell wall biosynthesis [Aestuariispira insulae]